MAAKADSEEPVAAVGDETPGPCDSPEVDGRFYMQSRAADGTRATDLRQ